MTTQPVYNILRVENEYRSPITMLWILRIILKLNGHIKFIRFDHFANDSVASYLGLDDWLYKAKEAFNRRDILTKLQILLHETEKNAYEDKSTSILRLNIERLSNVIHFDEVEKNILEFSILLKNIEILREASGYLDGLTISEIFSSLSNILDLDRVKVTRALKRDSKLSKSGILTIDFRKGSRLADSINLLSDFFSDQMMRDNVEPIDLLSDRIFAAPKCKLTQKDYEHQSDEFNIISSYLRHATEKKTKGSNILVYGKPGTGKSEMARCIAEKLNCELYEIACENNDGSPQPGATRLRSFIAAQNILTKPNSLIVFDEVEDVFTYEKLNAFEPNIVHHKSWINRILEETKIPSIWISNSIDDLDPAYVRRFDIVIELLTPPLDQRRKIVTKYCAGLINEQQVELLAQVDNLTPAMISSAARVAQVAKTPRIADQNMETLTILIENALSAQGYRNCKIPRNLPLPEFYDPDYINADIDINKLIDGLMVTDRASICLYGPPGTGKTALAHWLASRLGKPLVVKRASDLLSPFVGLTEIHIANAFKKAQRDNAILLIDEADSFLGNRESSARSWEILQVNEMLSQMESFEGLFIASTNLIDRIDRAFMRRFDLKAKFDFLQADQAIDLFTSYCDSLSLGAPGNKDISKIRSLRNTTPGDFAVIARLKNFSQIESPTQFAEKLSAECALKLENNSRSIGFIQ